MTTLAAVNEEQEHSAVVAVAYDLAQAYGDELVVLHAVPVGDAEEHMRAMRQVPGFEDVSVTQERERAAAFARTVVDNTLEKYDPGDVSTLGRVGSPEEEILAIYDDDESYRYLVMGGRRRSPVGKAVFGSATQHVLLNTDRPVMTVTE